MPLSAAANPLAAVAAHESGGEGHEVEFTGAHGLKGAPQVPIWDLMELYSEVTSAITAARAIAPGATLPSSRGSVAISSVAISSVAVSSVAVRAPADVELAELAETVDRFAAVMDLLALNASLEAMMASQRSLSADVDVPDTLGLAGLVARLSGTHRVLGEIVSERTARFQGGPTPPTN